MTSFVQVSIFKPNHVICLTNYKYFKIRILKIVRGSF